MKINPVKVAAKNFCERHAAHAEKTKERILDHIEVPDIYKTTHPNLAKVKHITKPSTLLGGIRIILNVIQETGMGKLANLLK